MASNWKKLSSDQIKEAVFGALAQNVDFRKGKFLGVPASHLDENVFYSDAPFLKDAPYMSTMVANPNNIGCHTPGESEVFFKGTQDLECKLIRICAEDILKGEPDAQDGYVASGGTEANIQAMWIYRNYFIEECGASTNEIGILCSADTHYSVYKAGNLLNLKVYVVPVEENSREIDPEELNKTLEKARAEGIRHFAVIANMATTMFGSVDDPGRYAGALTEKKINYKIHVDGAFGGFIYPFTVETEDLTFQNPEVTSFTLDAHKLAQAPYGTGIFLIRKGMLKYAVTEEAKYVQGHDITLIGSRSGANAVAVWMILSTYGPFGWKERIHTLLYRTNRICERLDALGVKYYRHPDLNIITIRAEYVPRELVAEFNLVPDDHNNPRWYKIVVMPHVSLDLLVEFGNALAEKLSE